MKPPSPADRSAVLESARALKMARSAHAFVRGNTVKFYDWLAASPSAKRLPSGPAIWICGDCHLGNLGPLGDGRGGIEIQIRDLDQTVIGNPAHDLIRLALSLATAARGSDLPGVTTAHMIEQMVEGYTDALDDPAAGDPGPEPDAVRLVRRRALGRRWEHLARERIDDTEPVIPIGKKFWALAEPERAALEALFADEEIKRLILSLGHKDEDRAVRLVDAAWWVKGCSSLGLMRYAAVVAIRGAKGRDEFGLVDVKEATLPAAPAAKGATVPKDQAQRVVAGARALSPHLGKRMIATRLLGRPVFIRELAPQDLKLEVEQFTQGQAVKAARYLAYVVGKAHARQMEPAVRADWLRAMGARRTGSLDAPSWLWESVVDLSGSHEAGYLEHCRRYALEKAA
ncbi:MAG: hypothetical protein JWN66_4505 [Sphingomonas bacterium]|uniref:DUF2252 family protein n=1 Tax=Sphingomonas bacterium TaxID=1895847 RepID=UPI002603AA28|nr:DUF2252 family protein [Sphingomonas bacterium]MDB5707389.1 hypothetical protein [Sphingomonas bacterium]